MPAGREVLKRRKITRLKTMKLRKSINRKMAIHSLTGVLN
jgi:hypothetical protein